MIRLTLMKEWFDRVDAERRSPIAERIAAPDIGTCHAEKSAKQ